MCLIEVHDSMTNDFIFSKKTESLSLPRKSRKCRESPRNDKEDNQVLKQQGLWQKDVIVLKKTPERLK